MLPPRLRSYLDRYVKLDAAQRETLRSGGPITKLLDADPSKEIAVFGAVWIDASIERYLAAVQDIEHFEQGGAFKITRKISAPPRLEDFAELTIPPSDLKVLRTCRVGDCELQLSAATIERLRGEIDWNRPDVGEQVNVLARHAILEYVNSYLQGGNAQLATYRDSTRPTFVAQEFALLIQRLPALVDLLPTVRRYLLEFPNASLLNSHSFIYWQEVDFGVKPVVRLNHLVTAQDPDGAITASKLLYASHYFWTALELRALLRDPSRGHGFWLIIDCRNRSNGQMGFLVGDLRGKVRGEAERQIAAVLQLAKQRMETK
jgi:hypothetical protein